MRISASYVDPDGSMRRSSYKKGVKRKLHIHAATGEMSSIADEHAGCVYGWGVSSSYHLVEEVQGLLEMAKPPIDPKQKIVSA